MQERWQDNEVVFRVDSGNKWLPKGKPTIMSVAAKRKCDFKLMVWPKWSDCHVMLLECSSPFFGCGVIGLCKWCRVMIK